MLIILRKEVVKFFKSQKFKKSPLNVKQINSLTEQLLFALGFPNRVEKYWICSNCVKSKHPDWGKIKCNVTCIAGLCGHCDREDETTLIPVCDYPKKGYEPIFD